MNRKRKSVSRGGSQRREQYKPAWDSLTQDHRQYQLSQEEMELRKSQRISRNHIRVWQQLEDDQQKIKEREQKVKASVVAYIAKHQQKQDDSTQQNQLQNNSLVFAGNQNQNYESLENQENSGVLKIDDLPNLQVQNLEDEIVQSQDGEADGAQVQDFNNRYNDIGEDVIEQNEQHVEDCSYCHQPLNDDPQTCQNNGQNIQQQQYLSSQQQDQNMQAQTQNNEDQQKQHQYRELQSSQPYIHAFNNNNESQSQYIQQQQYVPQQCSQQYTNTFNNNDENQQQQQYHYQQLQSNQMQQYMQTQNSNINENQQYQQSQQQQQQENDSQYYLHDLNNNNQNLQQQKQQFITNDKKQQDEPDKIDFLVDNLQQMSRCLGEIRNHQIGMESEFRTFMANMENQIQTLNSKVQEIEKVCDDKFGNLQQQIDQINQEKNPFLNNSFENFQQQQQQLSQQLENLRFDLSDKENQQVQPDQYLFQNENQDINQNLNLNKNIRNWGGYYPHGTNLPLGPVLFGDNISENKMNEQRLPLMTDHVPLGRAFAEGCCLEPKNRYS